MPKIVTIKMQDKIKVGRMMNRAIKSSHDDKTRNNNGIIWKQKWKQCKLKFMYFIFQNMACLLQPECNFLHSFFRCNSW